MYAPAVTSCVTVLNTTLKEDGSAGRGIGFGFESMGLYQEEKLHLRIVNPRVWGSLSICQELNGLLCSRIELVLATKGTTGTVGPGKGVAEISTTCPVAVLFQRS